MTVPRLRVAHVVPRTVAEGPGTRYAVWVQGCTVRCPGCFNPHLWTARGGTLRDPDALVAEAADADVDGITLLGGEPLDQPAAAAALVSRAQGAGLSTVVFTGRTFEELRCGDDPAVGALLAATDLLVDGPYDAARPDHGRPWVGSTNQQFHFLTDRFGPQDLVAPDRVEVRVGADGSVELNGWADEELLDVLSDGLGRRWLARSRLG